MFPCVTPSKTTFVFFTCFTADISGLLPCALCTATLGKTDLRRPNGFFFIIFRLSELRKSLSGNGAGT